MPQSIKPYAGDSFCYPHKSLDTQYAIIYTQHAAGATAGVLNTRIKRKIRSLLIRSVNRIYQLSAQHAVHISRAHNMYRRSEALSLNAQRDAALPRTES